MGRIPFGGNGDGGDLFAQHDQVGLVAVLTATPTKWGAMPVKLLGLPSKIPSTWKSDPQYQRRKLVAICLLRPATPACRAGAARQFYCNPAHKVAVAIKDCHQPKAATATLHRNPAPIAITKRSPALPLAHRTRRWCEAEQFGVEGRRAKQSWARLQRMRSPARGT